MGAAADPNRALPEADRFEGSGALARLRGEFEAIGLSPYAAGVLVALMRLSRADALQLSRMSGVPRTSIYPVLQELEAQGVAECVTDERPRVWRAATRDEVVHRLEALKEQQLREQRERFLALREAIADALPESGEAPVPYVRALATPGATREVFEELFSGARAEILAFSKPPYSWHRGAVNPVVVETARRGVTVRAIYEAASLGDQDAFRRQVDAYVAAGVHARVVDELPLKLVIADRERALVALTGPIASEVGYPKNLLFEHPGFASLQAHAFEVQWEAARPYAGSRTSRRGRRTPKREHGVAEGDRDR